MRRGSTINSWHDLQTMTNTYLNQTTDFEHEPFRSNKRTFQRTKPVPYYETDCSSMARRQLSSSITSLNNNHERAKSADHSQTSRNETTPMASSPVSSAYTEVLNSSPKTTSNLSNARSHGSLNNHSSKIRLDERHRTKEESEKCELNILNTRFGNYLDKIKHLVNVNANLRRQVDDAYRTYMGQSEEQANIQNNTSTKIYQHPNENQLTILRKQINEEVRAQTMIQIRLQRAEYDTKFYKTNIQLLSEQDQKRSEHIRTLKQKLDGYAQELELIKRDYNNREQDLKTYTCLYNEYMGKYTHYSNEYDKVAYERLENENQLYTLKETVSFQKEYYQRRQEEFQYLEKFHHDLHREFHKNEFHSIVQRIRKDYQELNDSRIADLEAMYKSKLDTIRNEIQKEEAQKDKVKSQEIISALDSTKQEHRALVEQNYLLQDKYEKLKNALHDTIEQNRQRYEMTDREYHNLQAEIPKLDCSIVHLRESAVDLWSEISTYRFLLLNLLSSSETKHDSTKATEKSMTTDNNHVPESTSTINQVSKMKLQPQQYRDETTGFIVHIEDGLIWVRI